MIIYLTDSEKKDFRRRKFTEREVWQIEKGLNDVHITNNKTGRRVSNPRILKEIGRPAYIAKIERAAFHGDSMTEKYYFDLLA